MCHTRHISCFDKQSEALIKKIPLHPVALSFLQTLYKEAMEWDHDPLVGYVYDIEQRQAVALAPYASEPIDIERYNCFLESTRPASSRKHIVAAGPDNLLAILDDDQQSGTLYLYNEDGTPSQGVIARTEVYRSEDVPDLRAVNIELGWSDDLTACWVRVGELYRELKVPALAVRSV